MSDTRIEPRYSARYLDALGFAARLHATQGRKMVVPPAAPVPYVIHLLEASALVWEAGGDEELAIAGLLHDAIEDQYTEGLEAEIERFYGARVLAVVRGCSDGKPGEARGAGNWHTRKQAYIDKIMEAPHDIRLVSLCDKVSNARATVDGLEDGLDEWSLFNVERPDTLWYYDELRKAFLAKPPHERMTNRFDRLVTRMHEFG